MLGLDLSIDSLALSTSHRASAPITAPTYLPVLATAGASYHLVASSERLLGGYAGPLIAAEGADFSGMRVAGTAVASARGTAEALRVTTLYDQTGAGRHYTQGDPARQPALTDLVSTTGALPIVIDGSRPELGGASRAMTAPATLAGGAVTRAMVAERTSSIARQLWMTHGADRHLYTFAGDLAGDFVPARDGDIQFNNTGASFAKGTTSPLVLILRERPDGVDLFFNGARVATAAAPDSAPIDSVLIGAAAAAAAFNPSLRLLADVVVKGTLIDADVAALDAALRTRFGIAAWGASARVNLIGDSIAEGYGVTLTRGVAYYTRPLIDEPTDWWTMAIAGKSLAQCRRDSAIHEGQVSAPASGRPVVDVIQGGTNDINSGVAAATLYNDTTAPYVADLKARGHRVVVCTLLPHSASPDATMRQRRDAYNALVRTNAAGADLVCDLAADPIMGAAAAPLDASLYADALHPTALGCRTLAPRYAAAINAVLAGAG